MTCPSCGDTDPHLNTHRAAAVEGCYSNGTPQFTPACQCGVVFDGTGTSHSRGTAVYLASRVDHPFGVKIYCPDAWHGLVIAEGEVLLPIAV